MSRLSSSICGIFDAAALLLAAGPVSAALIPLDSSNPDFADERVNDGDTATDGSVVVTFENPLNNLGGTEIFVDEDGIALGRNFGFAGSSLSIVFDAETVIEQYSVGFILSGTSGGFQLSGANGTSGINSMAAEGTFTFDMGTIPVFAAGQSYALTHTLSEPSGFPYAQLSTIQIPDPAPVPAPGSALLFAGGLFGLLGLRWSGYGA